MKRKIITILALLAVMVALTGVASASELILLKDGIKLPEPIPVKNGDNFNIDLQVPALGPQDQGVSREMAVTQLACTDTKGITNPPDPANCDFQNDWTLSKLIPNFTVTSIPISTQDDSVKAEFNVPLSVQPGTQYSFEITTGPFGNPPAPASASRRIVLLGGFITGKKCNDLDGNGICGQAEPGLAGWKIILRDVNGTEVANTTTDASGNYAFKGQQTALFNSTSGLNEMIFLGFRGTFTVEEVLQAGWTQTGPPAPGTHTVTVDANDATGLDFANIQIGSISGQKWNDTNNGDGIKDATEPRLAGWTITLTKPDGSTATTQTDASGNYSFKDLPPGTYTVAETLQAGWEQTAPKPIPPGTYTVNLAGGQNVTDRDFGNRLLTGSISGQKWNDTNGDGIKDASEPRLANWTITLTKPDGTTETKQTDANGDYSFTNLLPGTYTVSETLQANWTQTAPKPVPPGTYTVQLAAGQNVIDRDFGNKIPEVLKPGKVVGWGTLGNKAAPELTFKVWVFSNFMPKGTVEAEDDAGNKIVATEIDSVLTDKTVNPKTGEIKGKAMFNNEGPFDFVVKVTDGGQPPSPYVGKDTFDISIADKNYHKSGTLTSGDLEVVK